jgi:hypothetical protein
MKEIDEIFDGCQEITTAEARQIVHGKKDFPKFSIEKGAPRKLDKMLKKVQIGFDYVEGNADELKDKTNAPKMELPLFSFCIDDKVSAIVLDIENGLSMEQLKKSLDGFSYIAYFSASSTIEAPRLRAVIPLECDVPADEFDYCKERLQKAFCNVADVHSFESRRFFFMPSEHTGYYNEKNEIVLEEGSSIDFYKTTGFSVADRMRMKLDLLKKAKQIEHRDIHDDDRVQYYLTTEFPYITGNGDSASSLYTAIVTCLANDDEATLEEVLEKARSEKWTEKELSRKVKDAKKFLAI